MSGDYKRFAPYLLGLAGLAGLVSFGLYVVQRAWNLNLQISLVVLVLALAFAIIVDPDRTRRLLTGRQARYGSNALLLTVAFIGIVVIINFLVFENVEDWNLRWDLTEDKSRTLSEETVNALESLPEPAYARAFYTTRLVASADRTREVLNDYKFFGAGNFDFEFINPEADPLLAQQYGVTRDGEVVIQLGEAQETLTLINERELTSVLVRLMNPGNRTIYFLTGHGENSLEDGSEIGLSQMKLALENKNYVVEPVNLLASNVVPDDAAAIVSAGPLVPLVPEEMSVIIDYLNTGGAMIVLQEPVVVTNFGDAPDPMTTYLEANWGIEMRNDLIVDLGSFQPPFLAVASSYDTNHVITQKTQIGSIFPDARTVIAGTPPGPIVLTPLIFTGDQSWGETDFDALANQELNPDPDVDLIGPFSLAVVGENQSTGARMAVFGDSNFVANGTFQSFGNADLFVNTVDWTVGQEELVDLAPPDTTQRVLLPPQQYVMGLILLGAFVLPAIPLVAGIVVWIQRRRRG